MGGAAAAPDGAAATVEQAAFDAVMLGQRDDGQLRLVEIPVRRQGAAVLARIRVAEHDFLAIAVGRHQRPVDLVRQQLFENLLTALQVVHRFEQRRDQDAAEPVAAAVAAQADQARQQHHFHHVRGAVRHRNHVGAEHFVAHFGLQLRHAAEHRERLARLVVQRGIVHRDRVDIADPGGQALQAFGFVRAGIIEIGIDLLQHGGDGARMHGRFLTNIELQQVKAEAFHQPDQRLQILLGDDAVAVADQRIAQQIQVVEESGGVFIRQMRGEARHIGQALVDVGQVGIQPRQHDRRHAAVGFAAVDLHRGAAEHLFAELFFIGRSGAPGTRRTACTSRCCG